MPTSCTPLPPNCLLSKSFFFPHKISSPNHLTLFCHPFVLYQPTCFIGRQSDMYVICCMELLPTCLKPEDPEVYLLTLAVF